MNISKKLKSLKSVLLLRTIGKRYPLSVRFNLNNRCNLSCEYCNVWNIKSDELDTKEVFKILDVLKEMGTVHVSYSGGEPMLRKDIGMIIDYTKELGITCSINTNGFMIDKRWKEIKNVDLVKLSLDGGKKVHDLLRGKGSYDVLIKAIDSIKDNIKFSFSMTLTKFNLSEIEHSLELAKKYDTFCAFQPVKDLNKGKEVTHLMPNKEELRKTIRKLIRYKKKYPKNIRNSYRGLDDTLIWPEYKNNVCYAGKIFCMILPDGTVLPCDRISYDKPAYNAKEIGFRNAFMTMPPIRCGGCSFCGSQEMNYLTQLKFDVLYEINSVVK